MSCCGPCGLRPVCSRPCCLPAYPRSRAVGHVTGTHSHVCLQHLPPPESQISLPPGARECSKAIDPEAKVPEPVQDAARRGPGSRWLRPFLSTDPSREGCGVGAHSTPGQLVHVAFLVQGRACTQKQLHFMDQLLDAVGSLTISSASCSR